MNRVISIGDRLVGDCQPCFIIAEAGVNHNGNMDLAFKLIEKAYEAGADAVKFQSFITEELIIPDAPKADYQKETTGNLGNQYEMLKSLELSFEQQLELKKYCEKLGIIYICTPYDHQSVNQLSAMNISTFKIASTDTNNFPLLRYIARQKRPVLLSTGMSSLGEVEEAVNTLLNQGLENKIILLHCTSEYPPPIDEINLKAILTLKQAFNCPVGFSDHTPNIGASPWAVSLGACVIEKHFTLDRSLNGPDHRASIEPQELTQLVTTIRQVESALGDGIKKATPSEIKNKIRMQKSLVVSKPIKAGQIITENDLTCKRPGSGLSPNWFDRVVGKSARVNLSINHLLSLDDIHWS